MEDTASNMDVKDMQGASLQNLYRKFITGCHILHYHGVLDAYGHLSFRHPFDQHMFIMSKYIAPGTISSPEDLITYYVDSAEPVDPSLTKGYSERHIHSEVYKRHRDAQAVIHSHAESVIPYTISGVPLRPCYHMAGFLGLGLKGCPEVYDIAQFVNEGEDTPDLLVRSAHLGMPLAKCFDEGGVVALMRGHGMTVIGSGIEEVVSRAIYTMKNASIQTAALTLQTAHSQQAHVGGGGGGLQYLGQDEAKATAGMLKWSALRPWGLWAREVEACGLYRNAA